MGSDIFTFVNSKLKILHDLSQNSPIKTSTKNRSAVVGLSFTKGQTDMAMSSGAPKGLGTLSKGAERLTVMT